MFAFTAYALSEIHDPLITLITVLNTQMEMMWIIVGLVDKLSCKSHVVHFIVKIKKHGGSRLLSLR